MNGWKANRRNNIPMPARWAWLIVLLPLCLSVSADDAAPDAELFEYLGEWAGTDSEWGDPADILDLRIEDNKQVVTESQNGG
jgi:hypothetical protein